MAEIAPHKALEAIFEVVGQANRYVDTMAPWALAKRDPVRLQAVLWTAAETIRHVATATLPFMPGASARILDQLSVSEPARRLASLGPEGARLVPGTPLPPPQGVFPRLREPTP
jgi:methionyl-tRNA synthetase